MNYGLLTQSPMHTEALCVTVVKNGNKVEILSVCENRVSNLLQAILLLSLLSPPLMQLLGMVPLSVLGGIFLQIGLSSLAGNGVIQRSFRVIKSLWLQYRRQEQTQLCTRAAVFISMFQIICVACIFGVSQTKAGLIFPALIMGLLPLRYYVLPWLLGVIELENEDPVNWGRVE